MCRVSTHTTGSPASARLLTSHCDKGPASSPIRPYTLLIDRSSSMRASGSVATLRSANTLPASSTTQTDVSRTDTSRPANLVIALAPSSMLEARNDPDRRIIDEGAAAQGPSPHRRDTPSSGQMVYRGG